MTIPINNEFPYKTKTDKIADMKLNCAKLWPLFGILHTASEGEDN
jgi:hypothetical protein